MKEKLAVGSPLFGVFPSECNPKATEYVNVHFFLHSSNFFKLYK